MIYIQNLKIAHVELNYIFAFNVITDSVILCETANVENAPDKTKINYDLNEKRVHILRAV